MVHMLKTLRVPRWEDYEIRRREGGGGGEEGKAGKAGNMWAFLGDGRTEREVRKGEPGGEGIDLAPWMRVEDTEWTIDV